MTKQEFAELYAGKINSQTIANAVTNEIEAHLEMYREDGLEDCPNYEDLEMILNDIQNAKSFPFQLTLHTTAEDLYQNCIIENIEDLFSGGRMYEELRGGQNGIM